MKIKTTNTFIIRDLMLACLCLMLLFVQTFKMHVHIEHLGTHSNSGHVAEVHFESSSHALHHDDHSLNDAQIDFASAAHPAEINVSPTGVMSKLALIKFLVAFVLILTIVFQLPVIISSLRFYIVNEQLIPQYFLFSPPLRAPPL